MTEARIEEDPGRVGPGDLEAIVAALAAIAVSAEPAPSATTDSAQDWTLTVRWLQAGPVSADTEAALPEVFTRIREHFTLDHRTPPARLELVDVDGCPLLTIDPQLGCDL